LGKNRGKRMGSESRDLKKELESRRNDIAGREKGERKSQGTGGREERRPKNNRVNEMICT
jgi:hypothetical protein